MKKWQKPAVMGVVLSVMLAVCACGGADPSSQPAESASQSPSQAPSSSQAAEESSSQTGEAPLPEDWVEMEVPGTSVRIHLPDRYAQEDSGQDRVLRASTGDMIVMLAVQDKAGEDQWQAARDEMVASYDAAMSQQMGSQGVEQEDPQLPFASQFYAVLYEGSLDGAPIRNYGAFFATDSYDVFFQVTGLAQGWEEEMDELMDCLAALEA